MKCLCRFAHKKDGAITVIIATMLTFLIAFAALVTDVGIMYVNHSQLENMTDAGALAGAQEYFFNQSQVETVAENYALQNGKNDDLIHAWIDSDQMKVFVTASRNVDLYFAKILGKNNANISAISVAKIAAVSSTRNVSPFAITWDSAFLPGGSAEGSNFTLKVDEKGAFQGNFHTVRLQSINGGDSGANVVKDNIIYGSAQVLKIGDKLKTETGNMTGPIKQGITERLGTPGGNIVIIPIIEETWTDLGGGVELVTVKGFGAFDIDYSDGKTVTGNFIKYLYSPAEELADGPALYGLYGTRLVKP